MSTDAHEPARPLVLKERDPRGVVRLTLNRPDAFNALSEAMIDTLAAEFEALAADDGLRAVVIAGAGRAFCTGHDLKEIMADPSQATCQALFERCGAMMLAAHRLPVPVVARVHGVATAAGCQLVALCDLAVAAEDARFAVSGINLGLFCATPSVPLSRNLGRKDAFEMLVTGDFIDAREARARGLVNRVVPAAGLDAELDAVLDSILAKPRTALALGKALFYRQLEVPLAEALTDAARTMARNMADPDAREGIQAFIDKRPAAWKH